MARDEKRRDPGEFYPGGKVWVRPGQSQPQCRVTWDQIEGKPQIAPLPDRYRESDMKGKINEIASKFATAIAIALVGWTACARLVVQKAPKDRVWNDEEIVTNAYLTGESTSGAGSVRTLPKYLWIANFDDSYPEDAAWYYQQPQDYGHCSSVRDGNTYSRNLDWKFNSMAEVIVRTSAGPGRFASLGVANVGTNLTEEIIASGAPTRYVKALPGHTVDGINERCVVCNVNVVDGPITGWNGGDIHPLGAVRWVLDHATSALDAATNLAARIGFPQGWSQNFHWMVADADTTYIVENGDYREMTGRVVMTNFPLIDRVDGTGLERYNILSSPTANITNAWWTLAYLQETSPRRYSDLETTDESIISQIFDAWANGSRESHRGQTFGEKGWWQTVHTSVYDITNHILRVAVQEQDDWYTFAITSAGDVDEAKVREIVEPMVSAERDDRIASIADVRDRAWEGYTVDGIYTPGIRRNTSDINMRGLQIDSDIYPRLATAEQDVTDETERATAAEQTLQDQIDLFKSFKVVVTNSLPAEGEDGCIYLTPIDEGSTNKIEWLWIHVPTNHYEMIGTTAIDMSQYDTSDVVDVKVDSVAEAAFEYTDLKADETLEAATFEVNYAIHGEKDAEFGIITATDVEVDGGVSAKVGQFETVRVGADTFSVHPNASIVVGGTRAFSDYGLSEADPTVPSWAKSQTKPTYTYGEIGGTFPGITNVCVNGTTGDITNGVAYVRVSGIDGGDVTNIVRDLAYERIPEIMVRSNRWVQVTDPGSPLPSAYSGAVTNWVDGDLVLIYTNAAAAGSFTLDSAATVRILCVGGGGGGGNRGGGGGAGGFVASNNFVLAQGTYAVTVGEGGAGGAARYAQGSDGADSFIKSGETDIARAAGGGGGGSQGYDGSTMDRNYGRAGGSGGGSAKASATGGAGIAGQGHDGGVSALPAGSSSSNCRHGGGGGAGAAGGNGAGGNGLPSDILGFEQYFAGGGAGGGESGAGGSSGGLGGGAASSGYQSEGVAGEDGLGGGGSGGGGNSNNRFLNGGRGGSGIVVVRFVKLPVRVVPYTITSDLDDATNAIWQVLGTVNALLESAINGGN